MNFLKYIIVVIFLVLIQLHVRSQNYYVDSLKKELKIAKHDKVRCHILSELAENASDEEWPMFNEQLLILAQKNIKPTDDGPTMLFYIKYLASALNNKAILFQSMGNNKEALNYFFKSKQYFEELKDDEGLANSLCNIGLLYDFEENSTKAIDFLTQALLIQKKINDEITIAATLDNLGTVYKKTGNIPKAIELFHQSLKIQETVNNKEGITKSLMSIGNLYSSQEDIDKALLYYNKALKISEEINNKMGISNALHNISTTYIVYKDYPKAIDYCSKSLEINKEINDKNGVASDVINMGYIYKTQGNISKALDHYFEALKIYEEINKRENITYALSYITEVYIIQKKYELALGYATKNLKISKELGYPQNISNAAYMLKKIYKQLNKYQEAFEMYHLEVLMNDSIENENIKKASIKEQLKYEYEKQAAADSVKHSEEQKVKNAQLTSQAASLKQEQTQRYVLYGGLLLVIGFSVFVFNRFKLTQKQKEIIEEQKVLVDNAYEALHEKNKEVMDSIYYAQKIQRALLTPEKYIDKALNKLNKNNTNG